VSSRRRIPLPIVPALLAAVLWAPTTIAGSPRVPVAGDLVVARLDRSLASSVSRQRLARLRDMLDGDDLAFLLDELSRLDPPRRIRELAARDSIRTALGGGFYGMLPPLVDASDELPVPDGPDSLVAAALLLARARERNLAAIAAIAPDQPLTFAGNPFPASPAGPSPGDMRLELNLSPLAALVAAIARGDLSEAAADTLASDPAVVAMLEHRRALGYVPPPLPTVDSYARFLRIASSRDPVLRLWLWLNPWHAFGMADVREHLDGYRRLLRELDTHRADLERMVMGRICRYLPEPVPVTVTLDVGVNWGIRSWATRDRLGTNAVQFKDDYDLLLRTVTHETFHKVQQRICPVHGDTAAGEVPRFSDLLAWDLPSVADRKLHEILALIMLEGTATLVGGHPDGWPAPDAVRRGWELLGSCLDSLATGTVPDGVDGLVNEGLRSNGPFYAVGHALASAVVDRHGPRRIGELLQRGAPAFFTVALAAMTDRDGPPAATRRRLVARLAVMGRKTAR